MACVLVLTSQRILVLAGAPEQRTPTCNLTFDSLVGTAEFYPIHTNYVSLLQSSDF